MVPEVERGLGVRCDYRWSVSIFIALHNNLPNRCEGHGLNRDRETKLRLPVKSPLLVLPLKTWLFKFPEGGGKRPPRTRYGGDTAVRGATAVNRATASATRCQLLRRPSPANGHQASVLQRCLGLAGKRAGGAGSPAVPREFDTLRSQLGCSSQACGSCERKAGTPAYRPWLAPAH